MGTQVKVKSMEPLQAIIVDTDDPQNSNRVKIRVPDLDGTQALWAKVLRPYGSTNAGDVPELHDRVVVLFLNGDASLPLVLGRLAAT